jgi:hypothetical protein
MRFGQRSVLTSLNHDMEFTMKITRKQFLGRLIQGAAGMAGIAMFVGCSSGGGGGGGGGSDPTNPDAATTSDAGHVASCTMNGTISTIASNHGHVLVVSKADVAAGADKQYDITGTADHAHTVMVTVDMFTKLKGNTAVATTSTTDVGHSHPVTVMCA